MDERTQSTKISAEEMKLLITRWETALKSFAKLLGSIRFYPSNHPSLKDVTIEAKTSFAPLFQSNESVSVVVRRTGFFCEEEQIASVNPMLQKLAASLFSRKIQRMTFLKDLTCRDLWETAQIFLLDINELQSGGGAQALMQRAGVTTIGVNSVDMKGLFDLKKEIEEEKELSGGGTEATDEEFLQTFEEEAVPEGETPASASDEVSQTRDATLEEILKSVQMASEDEEFIPLLQQLVTAIQMNLNEESAHLVLQSIAFLAQYRDGRFAGEERKKAVTQAIKELAISPMLNFYADLLISRSRIDDHFIDWDKVNHSLGVPLAQRLLMLLADEDDQSVRKILTEILISQGSMSFDVIVASLQEDRWPTLRTATYLLGEIRNPAAIDPLRPLLLHRDLRVRREALRAMTRIGGNNVIAILAKILFGDDGELRRQAMLSLGAIKNPSTVPLLVQFLEIRDRRFLLLEAKMDAVKALGEIGSPDALQILFTIVQNRSFFYRRSNDELRAAALLAIGEIGGQEAIDFLELMVDAANPHLGKAATNALRQARKGQRRD